MDKVKKNIRLDILQNKVEEFRFYLASLKTEEDYNISVIEKKLLKIFELSNYYDNIFELIIPGFWRARPNDAGKLFLSPSDFEYPKWEEISQDKWRHDRFNLPGESMWYLSTSRNACISEIKPEKGSTVSCTYIRYQGPKPLKFLLLDKTTLEKSDPVLAQLIDLSKKLKGRKHTQREIKALLLVDDLMKQIATKRIIGTKRFEYVPSIAIQKLSESQNCDGIIYPSIAYGQNATNCVLFPRVINKNFVVDDLIAFSVTDAEIDNFYRIAPLLVGKSFKENGIPFIKWQYPDKEEIKEYSYTINLKSTSSTL